MAVDYASLFGIKSLAAPIVFAILYFPFFLFYLSKAIARPIYVYIIITLFCAIRIAAFVIRALLASVKSDQDNLHVLIAYEILYNTGFFGLLYSAYSLVTARYNPPNGPISRLLRLHFLFRIALAAAVALGITGAIQSGLGTTTSTINTGNTLRKVAIYIFLVCTILVFLQTLFLARVELSDGGYRGSAGQIGSKYDIFFLLVISLLLLVREAFFTATANKLDKQYNEAFWYPLSVVTEFIAVVLFATPGLVPA
ncbi:hypothetical protein JVT61DRAFT_2269 [Boletus reticuloceps]|uniref:Uncharacterized protein n=1 Tax=Boletus reticuloceps TaxID=495285 RepID=A0A8I3A8Z1_9AGAM|nr:hypothetical protein JVT61DRAFT_2269 [Boletus reticuloceps]